MGMFEKILLALGVVGIAGILLIPASGSLALVHEAASILPVMVFGFWLVMWLLWIGLMLWTN